MKVLRIILVLVALLVLLLVGIGFMGPTGMEVSHTQTIKSPLASIHNQVNNLKNWTNWSPWYADDPEMKLTYSEGDATGEGAWYSWESEKSGNGRLEIREVTDNKIGMDIGFVMDEELVYNTCDMMFTKVKKGEGTVVTWTLNSSNQTGFMERIANVIMPSMIKGQYEKGLNKLAIAAAENPYVKPEPKTIEAGMKIEDLEGFFYIGKRYSNVKLEDVSSKIGGAYGEIYNYLGTSGTLDKVIQPPLSLTEVFDRETMESTFVVAMKTSEKLAPTENILTDYFRAHKAMTYIHLGGYDSLNASYNKVMTAIRTKGLTQLFPAYEVYLTDPGMEPDMSKWETKIVVPVEWAE